MINLRVKIESNGNTFNFRHEMINDFLKDNLEINQLIQNDCIESNCKEIQDVTLFIKKDC